MTIFRFRKFASQKDWKIRKNIAYGQENGYIFTAIAEQGAKLFICPLPSISEENKKKVIDYLKDNKSILKVNEFLFEDSVLLIKFKEIFRSTKIETMNNLISELTNYLNFINVKGSGSCIFCGEDNAHETIYIEKIMYHVHGECYYHHINALEEDIKEYEESNKNYFRGFIGTLIAGVIISMIWSLTQVYIIENFAGLFSILLSFGLLKAYYMFKGKLGKGTIWIIAISTFISVILSQVMVVEIEMLQHGSTLKPSNFEILFGITQLAVYFKRNVLISLGISFVGFLFVFFSLKGGVRGLLPKIEKE